QKKSKKTVSMDIEDKVNKLTLLNHKTEETQEDKTQEKFCSKDTTTTSTQPLGRDAQEDKKNTLLKDITNSINTESSNYEARNLETREEFAADKAIKTNTSEIKNENKWNEEDFMTDKKIQMIEKKEPRLENQEAVHSSQTTAKKQWSSLFPTILPSHQDLFKIAGYDINVAKQHFNKEEIKTHIQQTIIQRDNKSIIVREISHELEVLDLHKILTPVITQVNKNNSNANELVGYYVYQPSKKKFDNMAIEIEETSIRKGIALNKLRKYLSPQETQALMVEHNTLKNELKNAKKTITQLKEKITKLMYLPDEDIDQLHDEILCTTIDDFENPCTNCRTYLISTRDCQLTVIGFKTKCLI
ncbi:21654_t:CDS:2, partial [Gigaspora rosea]